MKEKVLKVSVSIVTVVLFLVAFNFYLSSTEKYSTPTSFYTYSKTLGGRLKPNTSGYYSFSNGTVHVNINSQGWRGDEYHIRKPKDVYRIAVIGDSYIEAFQVPYEKSFTQQLEKTLNSSIKGMKFEVMNFGKSGFGTAQEYVVYKNYVKKYNPDMVILCFVPGNDVRNSNPRLEKYSEMPYLVYNSSGKLEVIRPYLETEREREKIKELLPNLYKFFKKKTSTVSYKTKASSRGYPLHLGAFLKNDTEKWDRAWNITEESILRIKREAGKEGSEFVLFSATDIYRIEESPMRSYESSYPKLLELGIDWDKPEGELKNLSERYNFTYIPLIYKFRKIKDRKNVTLHFSENGHWTAFAHHLAAEEAAETLIKKNLIQRNERD